MSEGKTAHGPCCDGVAQINESLAEYNATVVTTLFGQPKCVIATTRLRDGVRAKRAPMVLASYCPFCGSKYGAAQ